MFASFKKTILLSCGPLLCLPGKSYAQLGFGGGFEYSMPVFVNNQVYAKRPALGNCGVLSYCPRDSKLFPSFSYLIKSMMVPVFNTFYNGQDVLATNHNFELNLNYRRSDENNYSVLFIGLGVAQIVPETNMNDNRGNPLSLIDTGNTHLYPLAQIGGKLMHRILPNSNFYVGLEASLKYIRVHSNDAYYIQNGNNYYKATIAGDIIYPGIQLQLYYFFERGKEY